MFNHFDKGCNSWGKATVHTSTKVYQVLDNLFLHERSLVHSRLLEANALVALLHQVPESEMTRTLQLKAAWNAKQGELSSATTQVC